MERVKSWEQITQTGLDITAKWKALAEKYSLAITINGLPALTGYSFNSPNALAYKTLITQEMLAKGYLAATSVYLISKMLQLTEARHLVEAQWQWQPREDVLGGYQAGSDD